MTKQIIYLVAALIACCGSLLRAQETNAPVATNAPAPAAAPGARAANNDPAGGTTGTIGDASGAAGAYTYQPFQATEPAALSAEDAKDPAKKKTYDEAKKAFDDYTAQAKAEPLAVKLADAVGHNRVSINFVWTLVTGFLVMFMQAGFALVETGLCRAKNAAHTMSMNFMVYALGMTGFFICGYAFMCGGANGTPIGGPGMLGGIPVNNSMLRIGDTAGNTDGWGLIGTTGFFLTGRTYYAAAVVW